jgi:hypothetical protein
VLITIDHQAGLPGSQDGDNKPPPVAAQTLCHAVTAPTPNRVRTACHAAAIAVSASPHGVPAADGTTGSTSTRTIRTVKNDRTASTRPAKRRSHPRTVENGRPSRSAIRR